MQQLGSHWTYFIEIRYWSIFQKKNDKIKGYVETYVKEVKMVNCTPVQALKRTGTHYTGGWVGPRTGMENLAPTGIRSPDRAACS